MASSVSFKWNPNWPGKVETRRPLEDLGGEVAEDARRYVPVLSGALRDSIDHEVDGDGLDAVCYVTAGDREVDYATAVETGTSRMQAQPFLRPAVEQRRRLR